MNQEIIIEKSFIRYLENSKLSFKISEAQKCVEVIEQNNIISDENEDIYKDYQEELEKISNSDLRILIAELIYEWKEKKTKQVTFTYNKENILELTKLSKDKILFNPTLTAKEINRILKANSDVEVHNKDTFINPEPYHRLKNIDIRIKLNKDVYYDIRLLFEPFIRCSEEITIIDPFLPNNNALQNVKVILNHIANRKINLITHSGHNYVHKYGNKNPTLYESNWVNFQKFISELKGKNNQVQVSEFKNRKHQERYLITNDVKIILPGGMDFLDENGFPNIEDENFEIMELAFTRIDEES